MRGFMPKDTFTVNDPSGFMEAYIRRYGLESLLGYLNNTLGRIDIGADPETKLEIMATIQLMRRAIFGEPGF
jgi:hypothetical protein